MTRQFGMGSSRATRRRTAPANDRSAVLSAVRIPAPQVLGISPFRTLSRSTGSSNGSPLLALITAGATCHHPGDDRLADQRGVLSPGRRHRSGPWPAARRASDLPGPWRPGHEAGEGSSAAGGPDHRPASRDLGATHDRAPAGEPAPERATWWCVHDRDAARRNAVGRARDEARLAWPRGTRRNTTATQPLGMQVGLFNTRGEPGVRRSRLTLAVREVVRGGSTCRVSRTAQPG